MFELIDIPRTCFSRFYYGISLKEWEGADGIQIDKIRGFDRLER